MEHQDHHPDPVPPADAAPERSGPCHRPPVPPAVGANLAPLPSDRDILLALRGIDIFNSVLAGHKVEASAALLAMALDKDHDPAERRKCATAIMRAPFQRYPSAAAINGPTPPKSKRRKDDDDPDNNNGDGGDDDQPPTPPDDLMRAYDHGYWNGYATKHWPKATVETIEETLDIIASHAPGRQEPLQSDNLPELPYTHRHPSATDRRFPRRSVRTAVVTNRFLRRSVQEEPTPSLRHPISSSLPSPSQRRQPRQVRGAGRQLAPAHRRPGNLDELLVPERLHARIRAP